MKRICMLICLFSFVLSMSAKENSFIIIREWKFEAKSVSKYKVGADGEPVLIKEINEPVTLFLTSMSGNYLISCYKMGIKWKLEYNSYSYFENEAPHFGVRDNIHNFSVDPNKKHILLFEEGEGSLNIYMFESPKGFRYDRDKKDYEPLNGDEWIKVLKRVFSD